MLFNVPQNINVEDKIAGPLTGKQLMWMFGLGTVILVMYVAIPKFIFYVLAFPVAILFLALAFYRPNGQPLIYYVLAFFVFLVKPKVYVWKRSLDPRKKVVNNFQNIPKRQPRVIAKDEFSSLAQVLDSRGAVADDRFMDAMKLRKEQDQKKAGLSFMSGSKK